VEVITGPAGTGKTRVLAAIAGAWDGPVFGTATSQNATNELRQAGIQVAANTTRLLGAIQRGLIPPRSLIVADEGSMISITHLAALTEYAARNRCKLVLAGDQEQLAAVEGGGANDAPRGPARLRPARRTRPVHRRLGTRRLPPPPPRGRHRAG
jgi:ATP-dependent exoDNAse (exonuclease V) alpha subunit